MLNKGEINFNIKDIIFLMIIISVGIVIGWFWKGKQTNTNIPITDSTTVITIKDSLILRDSVSIRDSFLIHKKFIYKIDTVHSPCDTDSRVFIQEIPDTNFLFLKLNLITRGKVDNYKIDYQLKPLRIRTITEKTVIKEPYPIEMETKYWKIFIGGIVRPDERLKFNPGLLMTKDRIGISTGYDFQFKNINVGVYYLIFKF